MFTRKTNHLRAFTLIELSVVLIVIALIVGGVITASSLGDNAKLQAMMAEKEELEAAINQFSEKYNALPGDMYNATSHWAVAGSCPWDNAASSTVCNGNGNGKIAAVIATDGYESHQAWRQLSVAGFIDGEFNAGYESSGAVTVTPGLRVPESAYNDAVGWHVYFVGNKSGDGTFFDGNYGHVLYLGGGSYAATAATKGGLAAEHMLALDKKYDDGLPAKGKIRSGKNTGNFGGACVSSDAIDATYSLSATMFDCLPIFLTSISK